MNLKALYNSAAWNLLRQRALKRADYRCERDGRTAVDGVKLEVHHIVEPWKRPDLALEITNTECLCVPCHRGEHAIRAYWRGLDAANDPWFDTIRPPVRNAAQLTLFD